MHVEGVQDVHQLSGVGAGAVVEGERELVPPRAPGGDRGGVGEDSVDRRFLRRYARRAASCAGVSRAAPARRWAR